MAFGPAAGASAAGNTTSGADHPTQTTGSASLYGTSAPLPKGATANAAQVSAKDKASAPLDGSLGTRGLPLHDFLDQVEREAIMKALEATRFNKTAAAKLLGITFRSLRYRLDRLGID